MVNRFTFAGLVAVLALFGIGALASLGLDSGEATARIEAAPTTPPTGDAPPSLEEPAPEPTPTAPPATLEEAAEAAGCTLRNPRNEGAEHVTEETTKDDYRSNPPTSGPHAPNWPEDGIYTAAETPPVVFTVHTLEHGRINVQYAEGTPEATVGALVNFVRSSDDAYHMLLFQNQTEMPYAVAATAWDRLIGCESFNDQTVAALAAFRAAYIDKGPETVP